MPRDPRRLFADDYWTLYKKVEGSGLVPPQCLEIEQSVLGAIMIDTQAASVAIEIIGSGSYENIPFYREEHKYIYLAIISLSLENTAIDLLSVTARLRKQDKLTDAGGPAYLVELTSKVVTTANIEMHCRLILEKYMAREAIVAAEWMKLKAYVGEDDTFELLDQVEQRIFALSEMRHKKSVTSIGALNHGTIDRLEEVARRVSEGGHYTIGIPSGLADLDSITTGWQKTDLIILAARTSQGKTALSLALTRAAALGEHPVPTAFFSLEMGAEQLSYRLLCSEAGVDSQKGRKGLWNADDWRRVAGAVERLHSAPVFIDDTAGITPMELRAKCRQLKQREKIGLVIVDYLQLMTAGVKTESREREISMISQSLKALAKELQIPVIALSQLNRKLEGRENKRPGLSDLRESGSIENDADLVLFIYRPETYGIEQWEDGRPVANTAEIIVAKQRNGPIGQARVAFFSNTGRFEDYIYMPEFRDMDKVNF